MKNINEETKKSISKLLLGAKEGITVTQSLIQTKLFKEAIIKSWGASEKALISIGILIGITKPDAAYNEGIIICLTELIDELPEDEPEIEFVKKIYDNAAKLENLFQKTNTPTEFSQQDAENAYTNGKAIIIEIEKHLFTKIC